MRNNRRARTHTFHISLQNVILYIPQLCNMHAEYKNMWSHVIPELQLLKSKLQPVSLHSARSPLQFKTPAAVMKLLLVLALAVLATARPFTDEWEDFKKVLNLNSFAVLHHLANKDHSCLHKDI